MPRVFLLLTFSIYFGSTRAQEFSENNGQLNVYIDCSYCDMTILRSQVDYINYVRDPKVADVHILVSRVASGASGYNYTLRFLGNRQFDGSDQELSYQDVAGNTHQERQEQIGNVIQTGLVPFWMHTGLRDQMEIQVTRVKREGTQKILEGPDPWRNWIFSLEAGGSVDASSNTTEFESWGRVRVDKVSEMWRIRNLLYARVETGRFENGDEVITSSRERNYAYSSAVRSLSDHMSLGMFVSLSRSTFSNLDLSTRFGPAVEYNIYPYDEVFRRELTVSYRISHLYRDYTEQTIFQELSEHLFNHAIVMAARFKQPWGSLYAQLEGSHFLHDPSQNRLEFEGRLSFRVARGLSITVGNEIELINDQRSLPARDISLEELLLAQRQTATDFQINGQFGFKYTFGSIYNNVVNTRL